MSEAAVRARRDRRRWAAAGSSHDRVIATARLLLLIGIVALVALLAVAPLTVGRDISFVLAKDRVEVARERMRVSDAVYRGEDAKGQAFALRARSAVQATSRDPVVKLAGLSAELAMKDGSAHVTANTGRYDMASEKVAIDGPVVLTAPDDYRLETRDISVDLKTRRVESGGPVDGRMELGTFRADKLRADLEARTVVLDGRARLHIVQGGFRGKA